jgi:hypothetical protein
MNRIPAVLALAAALLLAGCVASKNPIGQTVGFKPDPALIGAWAGHLEGKKDAQRFTVYLLPKKDGGMTALAVSLPGKKDEGGWEVIDLKVAALGSNHFISARELMDDGVAKKDTVDFTLLLYRLRGGNTLTIYQLDTQKIGDLVNSGKLAGRASKGDPQKNKWDEVQITADPTSLDALMKTPEAAALFSDKFLVLHRQKPPQ